VKAVVVEIKRHRSRPDALLEVLHTAQGVYGHLPAEVLWLVARLLKLPPSRVFGVASFYHFFTLTPKGEHTCTVCTGTACYLKAAPRVLAALEAEAGAKAGATSADGRVTVQTVRYIGTCGLAPLVIADGAVLGHQTPESARDRVKEWRRGSG
jgi:bidirectional [NiFe] hydrogenase diaphorase subunit